MTSIYGPKQTKDDSLNGPAKQYLNHPVLSHMRKCIKYLSNLSTFQQYCVWRYTIGSASINSYLIFNKLSDNSRYWVYLFFAYYRNTFERVEKGEIPRGFTRYKVLFEEPERFQALPFNAQMNIAGDIIVKYIKILQKVILECPATKEEFNVYKVSSYYPQLPSPNPLEFTPTMVLQLPFNSTTISPNFNFAPFIKPESNCCFFVIRIPKGSRVLYVDQDFHAYPFENEIFLPFGCAFDIVSAKTETLNYIDPLSVNLERLQPQEDTQMGPVYDIDEYNPCKYGECIIQSKPFNVYRANYISPEDI